MEIKTSRGGVAGEGGDQIFLLYRYVPPDKVGFWRCSVLQLVPTILCYQDVIFRSLALKRVSVFNLISLR